MSLEEVKNEERLSNSEIRTNVQSMLSYIKSEDCRNLKKIDQNLYLTTLEEKYSDFKDRYPGLFKNIMLSGENFDEQKLEWMLKLLEQRDQGQITPDHADKTVVFREFNTHVKDKIDWEKEKTNFSQYSDYTDQ